MTATEPREQASPTTSQPRSGTPWWASVLIVILAVAVGFGIGYLAFGRDSTSAAGDSAATDAEAETLIGEFMAALNAYDTEAIRALAAEDAVLADRELTTTGALGYDTLVAEWEAAGYSFEQVGDLIIVETSDGAGDEFVVAQERVIYNPDGSELFRAIYAYYLLAEDGQLLIVREANLDDLGLRF